MPRQSPSSERVVTVGRGRGLGVVLRALVGLRSELTVIVATAEYVGPGAPKSRPGPSPAVGELHQALEALAGDEVALSRAMRRPLKLDRLGRHSLGNLMIHSLASGFGDLGRASAWLGAQLGIDGEVLPATVEPLRFTVRSQPARAAQPWTKALDCLRFIPQEPEIPPQAASAIGAADTILLAPGSLFRGMLVAAAVPDIARALESAPAWVVWICNLEPEEGETAGDQLDVLLRHGVRIDAALYDPDSGLGRSAERLADRGVETIPRSMRADNARRHDKELLRLALIELMSDPHRQHA
ncbi:MAG TPA: 2-phospho-L-lactate transferase CofD family protein [Solirubrobacteraceae bacterium]